MFRFAPVTYRSQNNVSDLFREMDRMEKTFFENADTSFPTDLIDEGNAYRIETELPGFSKDEIKVSLSGKYLTISAKHAEKEAAEADTAEAAPTRYLLRERRNATYSRTFILSAIETEGITVKHENGVLTVILPKKQPVEPEVKEIPID